MTTARVAILGAWHLGAVATAVIADWGNEVAVWDRDAATRQRLSSGRAMVSEPGLDDLLASNAHCTRVCGEPEDALIDANIAIIAYDTPVDSDDRLDLTPVDEAVAAAAASLPTGALLVIHSQVPVGYTDGVIRRLAEQGRADILVTVTPENLRLGVAISAFREPGHLAVGGVSGEAHERARAFWAPTEADVVCTTPATAEMSKHIINSVLATSTALGNELGDLARSSGADPTGAALLAKRDPRLRGLPILPGLPVGGGTLGRDLRLIADRLGPDSLPAAVVRSSDRRLHHLVSRVLATAGEGPVAILGLTYKPGTSATRRSVGVSIARALAQSGLSVIVFDPDVPAAGALFADESGIRVAASLEEAVAGAPVVAITTAHEQFRTPPALTALDRPQTTIHDLVGVLGGPDVGLTHSELVGP